MLIAQRLNYWVLQQHPLNSQGFQSLEGQDVSQTNCRVSLLIHHFGHGQLLQWDGLGLVAPHRHPGCVRRQTRDAGESEGLHSCHHPHGKTIFKQNKVRVTTVTKEWVRSLELSLRSFKVWSLFLIVLDYRPWKLKSHLRSSFCRQAEISNPPLRFSSFPPFRWCLFINTASCCAPFPSLTTF